MNGRIHFGGNSLDDSTGVVFGLQQPRHVIRRVTGNSRCFLFQPDVRIQIQIFVLSPPALLASATGEAHEISRRGLVNLVKGTLVLGELIGGLWHTTHPDRFTQVLASGGILPNPILPDNQRWKSSSGPQY